MGGGVEAAAAGNDLWHSNCTVEMLCGYGGHDGGIKLWIYSCQPAGQSDGTVPIAAVRAGVCALAPCLFTVCGMFNPTKLHGAFCCNHAMVT